MLNGNESSGQQFNPAKGEASNSTANPDASFAPFGFGRDDGLAKMAALIAALRQRKTPPDEDLKKEIKNSAFTPANAAAKNVQTREATQGMAAKNVQVPKLTKREQVLNAPQVEPSE